MIKKIYKTGLILLFFASSGVVFAEETAVTSFTATPNYINYGYITSLSWSLVNSSGGNLYFSCPTGVTIKKSNGSDFPCGTTTNVGTNMSDSMSFYISNVSGVTTNVTATLTPRDLAGTDYTAGSQQITIGVGTIPHPITDFNASSYYITTGATTTITWTGQAVPGTNISYDCMNGFSLYAVDGTNGYGALPCGTAAFTSLLPVSGSVDVSPVLNSSLATTTFNVRILPASSASSYDNIHSVSLSLTVTPKSLPGSPQVVSFSSAENQLLSAATTTLSWSATTTTGVNLQFQCVDSLTIYGIVGTTTNRLPCNTTAFSDSLPAVGTTSISVVNQSGSPQYISIMIYPKLDNGSFDSTKAKSLSILVMGSGVSSLAMNTSTTSLVTTTISKKIVRSGTITLPLKKGSRNTQVKILQEILAQDATLYPEGSVTGYFGPATEQAVKRFQQRYSIAKPGDSAYGFVGPKTRYTLNNLVNF